jgi:hypothetical protein
MRRAALRPPALAPDFPLGALEVDPVGRRGWNARSAIVGRRFHC